MIVLAPETTCDEWADVVREQNLMVVLSLRFNPSHEDDDGADSDEYLFFPV